MGTDKDVQVDLADLAVIAQVAKADVRRVPDLTHVLRRDSGSGAVRSYRRLLREPVDADLLTDVAQWLAGRLH